jgi:hypothetical protein
VPNIALVPILAPVTNPDVCPFWDERWEVRTRPLGCYVSTITFLTCLGSVFGTLLVLLLMVGISRGVRFMGRVWRGREEGWWRLYDRNWNCRPSWRIWRGGRGVVGSEENGETRPLLGSGDLG